MYKKQIKPSIFKLLLLVPFFCILIIPPAYSTTIKTLSIIDRIEQRIMPELYYALKTAANNNPKQNINFSFTVFNPRKNKYLNLN